MKNHEYVYKLRKNTELTSDDLFRLDEAFIKVSSQDFIEKFKNDHENLDKTIIEFLLFKKIFDIAKIDFLNLNIKDFLSIYEIYSKHKSTFHYLWKKYNNETRMVSQYFTMQYIFAYYCRYILKNHLQEFLNTFSIIKHDNNLKIMILKIIDDIANRVIIQFNTKGYVLNEYHGTVISRHKTFNNLLIAVEQAVNSIKKLLKNTIKVLNSLQIDNKTIKVSVCDNRNRMVLHKLNSLDNYKYRPEIIKKKIFFTAKIIINELNSTDTSYAYLIFHDCPVLQFIDYEIIGKNKFIFIHELSKNKENKKTTKNIKI